MKTPDIDKSSPLPQALREAASELRSLTPSSGFEDRFKDALRRADRAESKVTVGFRDTPRPRRIRHAFRWSLAIPAVASIGLIAHFGLQSFSHKPGQHYQRPAEQRYATLAEDGSAWLHLDLWTHHHKGAETTLRVHAHPSVRVLPTEHLVKAVQPPACSAHQCTHEFTHQGKGSAPARVRVVVSTPGRYNIRVEHSSHRARVQEEFLVYATLEPERMMRNSNTD